MRRGKARGERREGGGAIAGVLSEKVAERVSVSSGRRSADGFRYGIMGALALLASGSLARAASAYDEVIAPMLQARCVECHGEQKQKAKLALHTWDALVKGSDGGVVFVAGKPGESTLVQRMKLPVADEEHMPPAEKPQPAAEEIALVARWIERGASKTATVAELNLSEALVKAAAELPAKLAALPSAPTHAEPLWEFDPAAVEKARAPLAAKVAELQRRFPGALSYESRTSVALHFTAVGFGRDFGDAELAQLAPVQVQLVVLDVSGSGVTEAAAAQLGAFSNLRVFRGNYTALGDAAVTMLAKAPRLETLSLSGTSVTPACVGVLSKARSLKSLRVAGTAAEQPAQAANLPVGPSAAELLPPVTNEPTKPDSKAK